MFERMVYRHFQERFPGYFRLEINGEVAIGYLVEDNACIGYAGILTFR